MRYIVVLVCSLFMFSLLAHAHGGGLDQQGGHHNRKQGEYHFHRGPLAGKKFNSKKEATEALVKAIKKSK